MLRLHETFEFVYLQTPESISNQDSFYYFDASLTTIKEKSLKSYGKNSKKHYI